MTIKLKDVETLLDNSEENQDERYLKTGVSVVVPVYNEEAGVKDQLLTVKAVLEEQDRPYEIIAVDDGSQDRSLEEALKASVQVVQHPLNRGYGASLKTGIQAAQYGIVVIIDADGTYPASEIPILVDLLDECDMAVGARIGEDVHIPLIRRPAKWVLRVLAARIAERPIPDLNSGLRAFHKDCIEQYFPILSDRFSFTTTSTLALLADNYHVVYHPINYYARIGQSKITPKHFMDFFMLILRIAMLFQPLKIFTPLALTSGFLGILKLIFDVVTIIPRNAVLDLSLFYQPVISTSAVLLLLLSIQLLLVGMMADGVLRRIVQQGKARIPSRGIKEIKISTEMNENH